MQKNLKNNLKCGKEFEANMILFCGGYTKKKMSKLNTTRKEINVKDSVLKVWFVRPYSRTGKHAIGLQSSVTVCGNFCHSFW
jgi:hypothetical protein